MQNRRHIHVALGSLVWATLIGSLLWGANTVCTRLSRPVQTVRLTVPTATELAPGDSVFLRTDRGLRPVGEVSQVGQDRRVVTLEIRSAEAAHINEFTTAHCWQTPLTVEQAINALVPTSIKREIAQRLAADWRRHDAQLRQSWGPLVGELAAAYLAAVRDDLRYAIKKHEPDLWRIMTTHVGTLLDDWPAIQARLHPILQEHLNPVLGRLLNDAITTAPKMDIAWDVARGRNTKAFERMLDWMTAYLASMPESDRIEMAKAVGRSWNAALADPILNARLSEWGRSIAEDEDLGNILMAVYREAIAENPRTASFLKDKLLESEELHDRLYELIEALGPTARNVAATVLFDADGTTRPEVAHLVRYVALRRRVSWVTLDTPIGTPGALPPGTQLNAIVHEADQ